MTSRIDKLVREAGGLALLGDAAQLRTRPVTLFVDTDTSPILVRSGVALALRCFSGSVCVVGVTSIPASLQAAAIEEATEYGTPERILFGTDGGALALGLGCRVGDQPFVTAAGWVVGVNRELVGPPAAAPAAAFAAAAGVAKLFRAMFGATATAIRESWQLSLWSLATDGDGPSSPDIDLGSVLAIGAGAIGSGLAQVLRHSGWRGHIEFVDGQLYEEANHETTLLISQQNGRDCAPKAEILARLLNRSSVSSHGERAVIDGSHQILSQGWRALVVGVDNAELRQVLDRVRMPIYNAGVGGSRDDAGHVLWSRHDPAAGDHVLSSLYRGGTTTEISTSESAPADITDACSRLAYANVSLAAPFLGLAAGALLAAGLARRTEETANYVKLDLLGHQRYFLADRRRRQ